MKPYDWQPRLGEGAFAPTFLILAAHVIKSALGIEFFGDPSNLHGLIYRVGRMAAPRI